MQTLTPELEAILKAKLQAGTAGFRGRVEIDILQDDGSYVTTPYQAIDIQIDKSLRMTADQAVVGFVNEGLPLGWGMTSVLLTNTRCRVYEWYGDDDSALCTFTGVIDKVSDHRDVLATVITCRDMMAILIDQTFGATAPQGTDEDGHVRTEANGVYLSREISYIVSDILDRAGWPAGDRDVADTSFVLDEFVIPDGTSWADAIIGEDRLTGLIGYSAWADELGIFHFGPTITAYSLTDPPAPFYTFRAGEDIVELDEETDQYDLITRVKVRGPLTTTTLTDTWREVWRTTKFARPVGLWHDPSDAANLRVIDRSTKRLYKLRQSDRTILSSVYLGGAIPYPLGLSGDPADSSVYWVLNAPWIFTGSTSGNSVKKVRKSDNHVLATYSIPNGRWSALKVSATWMWLTNLDTDRFYRRHKTDGSASADYSHTYSSTSQTNPSGLMVDGTTLYLFWANGGTTARFLVCDEASPTVIDKVVKTAGTVLHGGEMDTVTHLHCYGDSDSLGLVAKFTLQAAVDTTTEVFAEVVNTDLEDELGALAQSQDREHDTHPGDADHPFEVRRETLDLSVITSLAQATESAMRMLDLLSRRRRVLDVGILGNPGLQKTDLVRVEDPVTGIATIYVIDTYRSSMRETYLGTVALLPALESEPEVITEDEPPIAALTSFGEGGWTQASRPNAVYLDGHTYFGWMNGANGNVEVGDFDHDTATTTTFILHAALEVDTHAAPAFLIRASDQRILAFYSKHDGPTVYMRVSTNPLDVTAWGAEVSLHSQLGGSGDYTYMQPVQLDDGTIFLFYRDFISGTGTGKCAYSTSTDDGATWSAQTVLFARTGHWVYSWAIAAGNRIDIAATDGAPFLETDVATWHAYYEGGSWHKTSGPTISLPALPSAATLAFAPTAGDSAWPWSITYDGTGNPVLLEQVVYGSARNSIRRVAWSGSAWVAHEIVEVDIDPATAGATTVSPSAGFSPGAVLDLDNSLVAYVCVLVSGVFEVWKYSSTDGVTWSGTAITSGSSDDTRYPFSPSGSGFDVLFLQGSYTSYLSNSVRVVAA